MRLENVMVEEGSYEALEAGLPEETPDTVTLDILRHSAAHLMAAAVTRLFPGAQYDVGPSIEDGFFYNFRLPEGAHFSEDDLARIDDEMKRLAAEKLPYTREVLDREAARSLFTDLHQPFKVDIIDRLPAEVTQVTVYRTGEFVDLCRGPHVPDSGWLSAVKLLRVAGVYWRGDEKNEQLQRIYGTAWLTGEELDAYLTRLEEAKKRDHRKLGAELDLFSISEEVGGGLVLWHPKGGVVRQAIEDYWRATHRAAGYDLVYTPHIADRHLWETSGHVSYYAENMFGPMQVEDRLYQLKPMSCPFHIMIYKSHIRSYRELPLRFAELASVYRYERSGVLHGLLRVRGITQDDAHIFCTEDQIDSEIGKCIDFARNMLAAFGFTSLRVYLSTRSESKSAGTEEEWKSAEASLAAQLKEHGLDYVISPGEGAFYGPKIDVMLVDALGREWQCSTIQFDYLNPQRFALEYVAQDGTMKKPIMVHRALLGSIERFMGCLIEHYAGAFPVWLAPIQCRIALVQDDLPEVTQAANMLSRTLREAGIRVDIDDRPGERMQARIRDAELEKIPYVLTLGKRDVERGDGTYTIRNTRTGNQVSLQLHEFAQALAAEIADRALVAGIK